MHDLRNMALLRRKPYNRFSKKGKGVFEIRDVKEALNLYEGTEKQAKSNAE